jgi:hypothetical protein
MQSVVLLLSVVMLSVVMLTAVMLSFKLAFKYDLI